MKTTLSETPKTCFLAKWAILFLQRTLSFFYRILFWIDRRGSELFNSWGTLESYSLVTQERRLLLNITKSVIGGAGRPKSLSADVVAKRLYWVDAR